ncbi:MAG TPA: DUF4124 domain-containing protein [Steroidobacteraceae bacterium]|nr:DUF4124 domain-containing protein [Steroidobacteraceae bacterium]
MPRSSILLAISIAALLGAAGAARADVVYEWTDAHGQVHYTDQWVPGAKVVRTDAAHRPATEASAAQGIQKESNAASQGIQQQQEADAVHQDEDKARAARCAQDKAEYDKLIQSRRIYTTDKNGQRTYLSDADADAARLQARQAMDADCGAGG